MQQTLKADIFRTKNSGGGIKVTPLPHRGAFNTFANRADPDQAALTESTLFSNGNTIRYDPDK